MALIEQFSLVEHIHCIVLYQTLPLFIIKKLGDFNVQLFALDSVNEHDEVRELACIAAQYKVKMMMLDGYHFSGKYRQALASENIKVAVFDDTNAFKPLFCDLIINALPFANALGYDKSAQQAEQLLGLDYSVIRKEFLNENTMPFKDRSKLLINFGGSDVANLTLSIVTQLIEMKVVESTKDIIVITGGAYCYCDEMNQLSELLGFQHRHNCTNMATILSQCKLAICAPGSIVYELAYCGVPSLFLTVADNQLLSAQAHQQIGWCQVEDGLKQQGIARVLQRFTSLWSNDVMLHAMSDIASDLVDGEGVKRICTAIKRVMR